MKKTLLPIFLGIVLVAHAAPKGPASIVSVGSQGELRYDANERGDRVPDFSTCGYANGDRSIPAVPVRVVVSPVSGDETARIQRALDYVGTLPADTNGIRGVVLLLKGRHELYGGLQITNSGIVLRGQGMNENGTVLVAAGTGRRTLIRIVGQNELSRHTEPGWQIADDYVSVGATSFQLKDVSGLTAGDQIRVIRPCTKAWIDELGPHHHVHHEQSGYGGCAHHDGVG
jgi:hypothetical protein